MMMPTATLRIGLLADSNDPFWVEVRETIWQCCHPALGGAPALDVELPGNLELLEIESGGGAWPGDEYVAKVEEILALELDALIAVPFSLPLIQRLLSHGLPIISLHERDISHPRFAAPQGLHEAGRLACTHLAQLLGGRGRVLIVGGTMGVLPDSWSSRVQAAAEVFAAHPGISLVHVPAPWDYEGAAETLRAVLEGTREPFDGLFGLSDTLALVGLDVCRDLGLLIPGAPVVGINGDPLAIAAIARGQMAATVATSAAWLASEALRLACLAATGESLPSRFEFRPQLVTRENVAQVALDKLLAISHMPTRLVGVNRRHEQQRVTQLETSLEINRRIGSILDRDALPLEIADLIRSRYEFDDVQILLWSDSERTLTSARSGQPAALRAIPLAESGVLGEALLRNRPLSIPNVHHSQRFAPDPAWPHTCSRVVVPIHMGDKTLGVLDLHCGRVRRHPRAELEALQSLADQLGVAIRNAQLYGDALSARAAAEQAARLKSRLLANVSHELRTPLNIILGYSDAALREPNPYCTPIPPALCDDLDKIRRSGQHLAYLINDLIDLSQAEIGALEIVPEPLDARGLLAEVFDDMAATGGQAVEWRLRLPARLPTICADPARLRQVLLNLLSNAAKFTSRGTIALGAGEEEGRLHIWVEDTGRGIAPERQSLIFDAFTAAADSVESTARQGIGLGLAVTYHLVRLHGGELRMESRPGVGTMMHVLLPLLEVEPGAPAASPAAPVRGDNLTAHANELVRLAATFIHDNYMQPLARRQVAEAVGVSADWLSRVFTRETGLSPKQYMTRCRVAEAKRLLLTTSLNVTEIAAQVGYNDAAYLCRVFQQEVGRSPEQFRRAAGDSHFVQE